MGAYLMADFLPQFTPLPLLGTIKKEATQHSLLPKSADTVCALMPPTPCQPGATSLSPACSQELSINLTKHAQDGKC